ncbi:dienelactone hydrolase protein [Rutstroemia sp. NJR-2017a WRK4]|nr:dienelactone hydrolase protein [Rutstroemia sp. NJR-2017a WRK4]
MATSKACNTIPPVTVADYKEKGTWETVADFPVYITGPPTPTTALLLIYDAFGVSPQTLQGADLLSSALSPLNTTIIMPDFFRGNAAKAAWFSPDAGEAEAAEKAVFWATATEYEKWSQVTRNLVAELRKKWEGVGAWGSLGLCWGGKVVAVTSGKDTPWKVSGQVHPGALKKEDAGAITIPHIVLASNGEDATVVQQYKDILENGKNGVVETYPTMHHGWMGARANLSNDDNLKEYARGYNQCASFFAEHLNA